MKFMCMMMMMIMMIMMMMMLRLFINDDENEVFYMFCNFFGRCEVLFVQVNDNIILKILLVVVCIFINGVNYNYVKFLNEYVVKV